ncbi:Protein of unknown function [Evansella caseinilytica]|uniref:DUF3969 family protein n=1 Tax=Evansella caseinilytica TaxID=1503961 RepID=A0A1H3PY28_9BACI|nr:DUF3969 family protein [Evansella caseinilytica]SDZ05986.1 Protein of unknown function [Evansella caseinilytica]
MELKIKVKSKEEIQQLLCIIQLGLLQALEKDAITIEEAEGYLFNPFSVEQLEKMNIDDKVVDIIRLGCELEDVQSLLPEKLQTTITELINTSIDNIKSLPKPNLPINKILKN